MPFVDVVFIIVVIIFSVIVHEVMHGVAADRLGDPTARYAGRLTLNPLPHIDMMGSILVPTILAITHSPIFFGWAKPVPYNPYNLRPGRFSEAIVAFAGPASNLAIAILAGVLTHMVNPEVAGVLFIIVLVNVMLFLFNLIPVPPLDGSKVLEAILPGQLRHGYAHWRARMEVNPFLGMGLVILFILVFGGQFGNLVYALARIFTGL